MYVVLTLQVVGIDRVEADFDYLHPDAAGVLHALLVTAEARCAVDQVVMLGVRPLLSTLCALRKAQMRFEARTAREAAMLGGRPRALRKHLDPILFHDVNTLYMGIVAGMFGGTCWFRDARACERCGTNGWSLTCSPPRVTARGRLVRDQLDHTVSFCWECLARRRHGKLTTADEDGRNAGEELPWHSC